MGRRTPRWVHSQLHLPCNADCPAGHLDATECEHEHSPTHSKPLPSPAPPNAHHLSQPWWWPENPETLWNPPHEPGKWPKNIRKNLNAKFCKIYVDFPFEPDFTEWCKVEETIWKIVHYWNYLNWRFGNLSKFLQYLAYFSINFDKLPNLQFQ